MFFLLFSIRLHWYYLLFCLFLDFFSSWIERCIVMRCIHTTHMVYWITIWMLFRCCWFKAYFIFCQKRQIVVLTRIPGTVTQHCNYNQSCIMFIVSVLLLCISFDYEWAFVNFSMMSIWNIESEILLFDLCNQRINNFFCHQTQFWWKCYRNNWLFLNDDKVKWNPFWQWGNLQCTLYNKQKALCYRCFRAYWDRMF